MKFKSKQLKAVNRQNGFIVRLYHSIGIDGKDYAIKERKEGSKWVEYVFDVETKINEGIKFHK
jgi:hypothetical protein